ncbi:MAG: hypothetical protein EBS42_06015, partial [Caulobacteraceae bacterium]|nr:hypothetical protein [Caulobacteraceae bacterium]
CSPVSSEFEKLFETQSLHTRLHSWKRILNCDFFAKNFGQKAERNKSAVSKSTFDLACAHVEDNFALDFSVAERRPPSRQGFNFDMVFQFASTDPQVTRWLPVLFDPDIPSSGGSSFP